MKIQGIRIVIMGFIVTVVFGTVTFVQAEDGSSASNSTSKTEVIKSTETKANTTSNTTEHATKLEIKKNESETAKTTTVKAPDAAKHCEVAEKKIGTITTRYNTDKERNVNAYKNMHDRITTFIKRFNEKGFDTTKLTADLATLDTKIVKLQTDHAAYLAKLAETKQFVCGKSEGQFRTTLNDTRTLMAGVKADITDIHSFYETAIRGDLIVLKQHIEDAKKTSTGSATEPTTGTTSTVPSTSKEIK